MPVHHVRGSLRRPLDRCEQIAHRVSRPTCTRVCSWIAAPRKSNHVNSRRPLMYARMSALLVAFAVAVTGLASAQERFGTLTGKVTDEQNAAVPGVSVIAR